MQMSKDIVLELPAIPKNIALKVNEACELINTQDPEKLPLALEILKEAHTVVPNNAVVLFNIGTIHLLQNDLQQSEDTYRKAIDLDPLFTAAWSNLGCIARTNLDALEAKRCFSRAVELDRTGSCYLSNLASCYTNNGTPDAAIKLCLEALSINPDDLSAQNNLSVAYLEKGNWEKGFEFYDARSISDNREDRNYSITDKKTPRWQKESNKTVVVYGEQGIGDELMFGTLIKDVEKEASVILDVHPRLISLFRRSFPNLAIYGTRKNSELHWCEFHKIDAQIPMASLAKLYRKKDSDFPNTPYLRPDPALIELYANKLNKLNPITKKVGISWKGGVALTNAHKRELPMTFIHKLLHVMPDISLISLQYHTDSQEDINHASLHNDITHWPEMVEDYDHTAALVKNLDYIISVPQSVVHLAGSMGKQTYQLTPREAMWQMGPYPNNMPWYGCVDNIWQDTQGDWDSVFQKLIGMLQCS